jgi:hypothetical protein
MTPSLIGVIERGMGSLRSWLVIAAVIAGAVLPYLAVRVVADLGWPGLARLVRERECRRQAASLDFWDLRAREESEEAGP